MVRLKARIIVTFNGCSPMSVKNWTLLGTFLVDCADGVLQASSGWRASDTAYHDTGATALAALHQLEVNMRDMGTQLEKGWKRITS